jgi:DNA-binding CsgD family transcriptional regulator
VTHSAEDLPRLLVGLYDLYRHHDWRTLPARICSTLARIIPCDSVIHASIEPAVSKFELSAWPEGSFATLDHPAVAAWHMTQHPLAAHYLHSRDARAWRISDFLSHGEFSGLELYRFLYQRHGIEYQLAMSLPEVRGRVIVVALQRKTRDFSEQERHLLELLWPHLTQAMRNARAFGRQRHLDSLSEAQFGGPGIIVLDRQGTVQLCNERARLWLMRYCDELFAPRKIQLPRPLALWFEQQLARTLQGRSFAPRLDPLILQRDGKFLAIKLMIDHGRGEHLLTMDEEDLCVPAASLQSLNLTAREAEVLSWVAQGKTNREIGMILQASSRTVQKHLEHVFEKLGVENRTSAILRAWQVGRYTLLRTS